MEGTELDLNWILSIDNIDCIYPFDFKEFQIPEIPCRMSWWKNCLCLGFSTEYSLLDVSTGSVIELQTLKEPPSPAFLKGLPHDQLIVTTQSTSLGIQF
jgi:hypothetical protein